MISPLRAGGKSRCEPVYDEMSYDAWRCRITKTVFYEAAVGLFERDDITKIEIIYLLHTLIIIFKKRKSTLLSE